jgi:hypothetical protein
MIGGGREMKSKKLSTAKSSFKKSRLKSGMVYQIICPDNENKHDRVTLFGRKGNK